MVLKDCQQDDRSIWVNSMNINSFAGLWVYDVVMQIIFSISESRIVLLERMVGCGML